MRKNGPETDTWTRRLTGWSRAGVAVLAAGMLALGPVAAQDVESFDPDEAYAAASEGAAEASGAIDADLANPALRNAPSVDQATGALPTVPARVPVGAPVPVDPQGDTAEVSTETITGSPGFDDEFAQYADSAPAGDATPQTVPEPPQDLASAGDAPTTYQQDDLIGAAEGVFGKGAEGLAGMIENLLREQGEPNGYIVGREGGGAFIFGVRYGSGTLHHKVEGARQVYWTGPSLGLDAGANAGNTFVLVYNLYDSEDIFRRYPAGEGQAYFVGGLHASYMRRGDVVLIPIRVGAGLRLGVNAGYMRFSKKQRWLPF
ncbi:DUF1134 domain-containing protein [uncultured Erythrobacter sp.]|uniref:DUF1134 domain-containing protein n=1 Tax=uncultured Erythrobacter sp. TaxID=263913 RepID=UPI00262A7089|nr:DUF1134 domain-containing protein [uncultured Erythrobacter sp.]